MGPIRAKFICNSVRKYQTAIWEGGKSHSAFLYEYEFFVVTGDSSVENKQFFASTPSGQLKMSAVRDDLFAPGQSYYLDFSPSAVISGEV